MPKSKELQALIEGSRTFYDASKTLDCQIIIPGYKGQSRCRSYIPDEEPLR